MSTPKKILIALVSLIVMITTSTFYYLQTQLKQSLQQAEYLHHLKKQENHLLQITHLLHSLALSNVSASEVREKLEFIIEQAQQDPSHQVLERISRDSSEAASLEPLSPLLREIATMVLSYYEKVGIRLQMGLLASQDGYYTEDLQSLMLEVKDRVNLLSIQLYQSQLESTDSILLIVTISMGLSIVLLVVALAYGVFPVLSKSLHTAKKLSGAEVQYRTILETAVEGIITITPQGIVEVYNRAAELIFGWKADEVVGKNIKMLMSEPDSTHHDGYLQNYLKTGQRSIIGGSREVQGKHRDGHVFPLRLSVSEVQIEDRTLFTGILSDLSQQKQAEQELIYSAELDQLISHIGTLLISESSDLESSVIEVLQDIGTFFDVDRCTIVMLGERESVRYSFTWNSRAWLDARMEEVEFYLNFSPVVRNQINSGQSIQLADMTQVTAEYQVERDILQEQGIQSLLILPMLSLDGLRGLLILESPKPRPDYYIEETTALSIIRDNLISYLEKSFFKEILVKERDLFEAILESSGILFMLVDAQGKLLRINQHGRDLFNLLTGEIPDFEQFAPQELKQALKQVLHKKETIALDGAVPLWNQPSKVLAWNLHPFVNEAGQLQQILCTGFDITDRKRAETRLMESERLLSNMMNNMPGMVYSLQLQPDFKMVYSSGGTRELLGLTSLELVQAQKNLYRELIHPEDRPQVVEAFDQAIKHHSTLDLEYRIINVHNEVKWVWERASYYRHPDDLGAFFDGFVTDITRLKITEQKLKDTHDKLELHVQQRTHELQLANEELKSFSYIVSHDLRSPLVNIRGFSDELNMTMEEMRPLLQPLETQLNIDQKQKLKRMLNQEIPESLKFINASVNKMTVLTDAMLRLSRLGHRELTLEPLNMREVVEKTLEDLAFKIESGQVRIELNDLPHSYADWGAMEQVWSNLLDNALKFLKPDQEGTIRIDGEDLGEKCLYWVQDNGQGIEERERHRIFEIFQRAGKHQVPGEGMGLTYVRTLVRRHGGGIWCESKKDFGTTFFFTLAKQDPST